MSTPTEGRELVYGEDTTGFRGVVFAADGSALVIQDAYNKHHHVRIECVGQRQTEEIVSALHEFGLGLTMWNAPIERTFPSHASDALTPGASNG